MDRHALTLQASQTQANRLASQAAEAALSCNVLGARTAAELAAAEAQLARQAKKADNADKALTLIGQKLDSIQPGEGNLDTLVRVVTALDPPATASQAGVVVQVQVSQEWRER